MGWIKLIAWSMYSQYYSNDNENSIATEGKRLAEHLVTLFAASSSDPLGASGECLASAALWLQNMKCSLKDYQNSNAGMHTSPFMSTGFTTFRGIPLTAEVTKGTESMISQNPGNSTPVMAPQSALNMGDYSQVRLKSKSFSFQEFIFIISRESAP